MDAARLVQEDSYASRGALYGNDIVNASNIHDQLDEEERDLHGYSKVDKGKARGTNQESDDDDEEEDGMRWAPQLAKRGSHIPQDQYQNFPNTQFSRRDSHGTNHQSRRSSRAREVEDLTASQRRILWWKSAAINVLFICAWYTFSTLISIYNKWMFSKDHYNFKYPLFVTSCHMLVQFTLSSLTLTIFPRLRSPNRPELKDYGSKIVPCGMATGLDIGLSNLSLRSITLSFYTMCKSSSLAFVLLFAFIFKLEKPSWKLFGIILIITGGVVLMVSTETQFDFVGMVEVLSASALGGLRWSLTQILLDKESMGMGNPIATLFWLAPIMGVTLATTSMIVDGWGNVFGQEDFFGSVGSTLKTAVIIFCPGVLAFAMNVTEFGLIQRTSVVTLSVAGIFKEVAVIFLSMFIFHDQLTPINVSGLCVTIFGIALYNYLKYTQFTKGEGGHGHGHGGHGGHGAPKPGGGFAPVPDESQGEDEAMLSSESSQARAARALGSGPSQFQDHDYAAPLHSLGGSSRSGSSSGASSARSSIEIPSTGVNPHAPDQHSIHRSTAFGIQRQHEHDRIEGLEERLFDADLELQERAVVQSLESRTSPESTDSGTAVGKDGQRKETDDWDLLGADDESSSFGGDAHKKLV
ncbi:TPT-domain-containing protein [Meredithblackwellia eburnea MCA 4105]